VRDDTALTVLTGHTASTAILLGVPHGAAHLTVFDDTEVDTGDSTKKYLNVSTCQRDNVTKRAVLNRSLPLFPLIFRVELPVMACLYTAHFEAIEIEVALTTTLIAKFIGHFDVHRLTHIP
jgi:hypothetical protein